MPFGKKATGKASAFFEFLKEEGKSRFEEEHGAPFDNRNAEHLIHMDTMWQNVTEEKREAYKKKADVKNADKVAVQARRQAQDTVNRNDRHNDPDGYIRARQEHKAAQKKFKELKKEQEKDGER